MKETEKTITTIPLCEIDNMPDNPYSVRDDEDMAQLTESISSFGVIVPLLVRTTEDGRYELISGHRRKYACEALGITEIPCEVIECSRDEAVILAVDSNAQRQKLLPSERAFAYSMKLKTLNLQGKRTDLDSCQSGTKLNSGYNLAAESGESRRKIYRLIRLTELIPELRDAVDTGRIALSAGVELSYLPNETQEQIEGLHGDGMPYPTYSQANQLKKMAASCELSEDDIEGVLRTPAPKKYLVIPAQRFGDMFRGYSNAEVEDVVERALKIYKRYLQSQRGCR